MRKLSFTGVVLTISFIIVSCGNSPQTPKTSVEFTKPSEVLIEGDKRILGNYTKLVELIKHLRSNSYNPFGYRLYYYKIQKDDYGNEKKVRDYFGGTYKISKSFYNETRKFKKLTDIIEIYYDGDDVGTEKGWKLFQELRKCDSNGGFMWSDKVCEVTIPESY